MINLHITLDDAQLIKRILLSECIEMLQWMKQSSAGPEKDQMQCYIDKIQTALVHITKSIELEKGTEYGHTSCINS